MKDEVTIDQVIRLLSKLNLRVTPQRIYITKIILENVKSHPSFKEIYEMVKKEMPSIGVSTLFNTLKVLEKNGVITLFEYEGETHIDLPHPHVNVHCRDKGIIMDFDDPEINRKLDEIIEIAKTKNIKAEKAIIIIEGSCGS